MPLTLTTLNLRVAKFIARDIYLWALWLIPQNYTLGFAFSCKIFIDKKFYLIPYEVE